VLLDENPGIEDVVTHVIPADDVVQAFATARDSRASGKVVVEVWPSGQSR